jgi:hypothetical protein
MHRFVGVFAVGLLALLAVGCEEEAATSDRFSFEDAVEAMEQPGKVFYAEWELPAEGDQRPVVKTWYWPEREVIRTELHDQAAHRATTIYTPEREVSHQIDDGLLDDRQTPGTQWDDVRGGGAAFFPHISYWATAQEPATITPENVDGRSVLHVRSVYTVPEDRHEQPKGTTYTADTYLLTPGNLPLSVTLQVAHPGQQPGEPGTFTFTKTEFLDRGDLPADFFDQDALAAAEVTLDEAIERAANQPFVAYWLGREIDVEFDSPDGSRHDSTPLGHVTAPGMARSSATTVTVEYAPAPHYSPSLLTIVSSGDSAFTAIRPSDLEVLERTGSVTALADGTGFIYAQYISRGSCTLEQAQLDAACRMFAEPTYGLVLELGRTKVHFRLEALLSGDSTGAKHLNPFNDPALLEQLARELRPIE